jgi:hypothetical protein
MSSIYSEGNFIASCSKKGVTQDFNAKVSPKLGMRLIDSPGLADPDLQMSLWLEKYKDDVVGQFEAISLCIIVVEYAERCSSKE